MFLDEIGEMPLEMQPKLLRALETNQVTPVGADRTVDVDTRLVAATNRNLMDEIKEGRFREDLFYRLNVVELIVPPLADRREDIIPLARHFANQFANRQVRMSPQASQAILTHSWTGNVRELRNAIQRACLLCQGDVILPEHLPANIAADATAECARRRPIVTSRKSNDSFDTRRMRRKSNTGGKEARHQPACADLQTSRYRKRDVTTEGILLFRT